MSEHNVNKSLKLDPSKVAIDKVGIRIRNLAYGPATLETFQRVCDQLILYGFKNTKNNRSHMEFTFKDIYGAVHGGTVTYSAQFHLLYVNLNLNLNPTRRVREILQKKEKTKFSLSLDQNDNFIPSYLLKRLSTKWSSLNFQEILSKDINLCIDTLNKRISNFTDGVCTTLTTPTIYIACIELYWDLIVNGAIKTASQLAKQVAQFYKDSESRDYKPNWFGVNQRGNGIGIQVPTAVGERLQVYSKSHDLLRVEFSFTGDRIRYLAGSNNLSKFDSIEFLIYKLLSNNLETLNKLLRSSSSQSEPNGSIVSDLFHTINACKTEDELMTILPILGQSGGLRSSSEFRNIRARFRRRGVVNKGARGVFKIRLEFQRFLIELHQLINNFSIDSTSSDQTD